MPVTEPELALLLGQQGLVAELAPLINGYGAEQPAEWAGSYVDEQKGGTVAILFTGHIVDHEVALAAILPANASWEVRQVRSSLADLQALADRIKEDRATLSAAGAKYFGGGVHERENVAYVIVESHDPSVASQIIDHYNGQGRLEVELIESREWPGGRGRLIVVVEHQDGTPAKDVSCRLAPDDSRAWGEDERVADSNGRCTFDGVGATGVTAQVFKATADGHEALAGQARADVVANGQTEVTVILRP